MRIIFICHDASRTGVPLLLLQLIRWLKMSHNVEAFTILLRGGPLEKEFRSEGKVFTWHKKMVGSKTDNFLTRVILKVTGIVYRRLRKIYLKKEIRKFNTEVIYLNTVAALSFLQSTDAFNQYRKILHCHEMPYTIRRYVPDSLEYMFKRMDKIIVVNKFIEHYFLERGIQSNRLLRVTEYLCKAFPPPMEISERSETFKVISVGRGSWRKGIDLFVLCAYYFSKIYDKPFSFTWIGFIQPSMLRQLEYDIAQFGLIDQIRFAGELTDTSQHLNESDIFFLTSREDPYPLVMLEAAWFEKPVLYFANTGGASEFVNDQELAVNAFDVYEAANRLHFFAENKKVRMQKGETLKKRMITHTVENVGKTIFEVIQPNPET